MTVAKVSLIIFMVPPLVIWPAAAGEDATAVVAGAGAGFAVAAAAVGAEEGTEEVLTAGLLGAGAAEVPGAVVEGDELHPTINRTKTSTSVRGRKNLFIKLPP